MPAPTFYGEMLQRLLESLAAVAGAVWIRTAAGQPPAAVPDQRPADRPRPQRGGPAEPRRAAARRVHRPASRMTLPPHSHHRPRRGGPARAGQPLELHPAARARSARTSRSSACSKSSRGRSRPARRDPRLPAVHDHDGRPRRPLPAQPARRPAGRPAAAVDPARGLRPHHPRQPQPDRGRLPRRQRGPAAHRVRPRLRRRPPRRREVAHRGRLRHRRGRTPLQHGPPHARPVRRRPRLGRAARLHRHQGRQPAAEGPRGDGRLPRRELQQDAHRHAAARRARGRRQGQAAQAGPQRARRRVLRDARRHAADSSPGSRSSRATPRPRCTTPSNTTASRCATCGCRWPSSRRGWAARPRPS